jgi:hypothetical protein
LGFSKKIVGMVRVQFLQIDPKTGLFPIRNALRPPQRHLSEQIGILKICKLFLNLEEGEMRLTYLSSVVIVEIVVFLRGGAVDLRTLLARPTHLVEQRATPAHEPMVYHPVDRQPFYKNQFEFQTE